MFQSARNRCQKLVMRTAIRRTLGTKLPGIKPMSINVMHVIISLYNKHRHYVHAGSYDIFVKHVPARRNSAII